MLKRLPNTADPENTAPEEEMSFLDHLEELRWCIIRSLIAIVVVAIVAYVLEDLVFKYLIFAPKNKSFVTYQLFCSLGEQFCFDPPSFEIVPREMGEQFFTSLKVSFWIGLVVAFPYVFYQFWQFISPGLYSNERKATRGVVLICSALFLLGVTFGYIVMSPFAIRFLAGYSVGVDVTNSTSLSSYVGYLTMFTIPTGIVFELPILIYFLSKIGLVTPAFLKTYRKHAFVIILILAAVITPPDVVTQFMIGVPVFLLYEISIIISARVTKAQEKVLNS